MSRNVLSLILYITKVNDKVYAGIDGKLSDIEDFGFSEDSIKELAGDIEIISNKIISNGK